MNSLSLDAKVDCEVLCADTEAGKEMQISFVTRVRASSLKAVDDRENSVLESINQLIDRSDMNGVKFVLCAEKVTDSAETSPWKNGELYRVKMTVHPQKNPAKDPPPCLKTRQKISGHL